MKITEKEKVGRVTQSTGLTGPFELWDIRPGMGRAEEKLVRQWRR